MLLNENAKEGRNRSSTGNLPQPPPTFVRRGLSPHTQWQVNGQAIERNER